jgi:hypothetical protein
MVIMAAAAPPRSLSLSAQFSDAVLASNVERHLLGTDDGRDS